LFDWHARASFFHSNDVFAGTGSVIDSHRLTVTGWYAIDPSEWIGPPGAHDPSHPSGPLNGVNVGPWHASPSLPITPAGIPHDGAPHKHGAHWLIALSTSCPSYTSRDARSGHSGASPGRPCQSKMGPSQPRAGTGTHSPSHVDAGQGSSQVSHGSLHV
jgi:hypothetical protein